MIGDLIAAAVSEERLQWAKWAESSSLESRYGAANYKPLPVILVRGEGVHVWDKDGR